jgi:lipopolysaccharide biosynthesis protein
MKTVILYVFHDITPMVKYFDKRTFKKDGYDFIYIMNNDEISDQELSKLNLCNVYKLVKRKNVGNDFGAWSDTILEYELQNQYDNFIFINSSVYGPISNEEENDCNWCDTMLNGLNEDVKLFGSTINGAYNFHVQSYAFCMKSDTLKYLIKEGIFKKGINSTKSDLIQNYELKMSKLILKKEWNIGCLSGNAKNLDFRKEKSKKVLLPYYNYKYPDIQFRYFLHNILKPKEVLFVKGNRDMKLEEILFNVD